MRDSRLQSCLLILLLGTLALGYTLNGEENTMKKTTYPELTRSQILAFRRRAAALDERLPRGR